MEKRKLEFNPDLEEEKEPEYKFRMKTALIYDAVYTFALAMRHLNHMPEIKPVYCNMTDNWEHGLTLITYMKTVCIKRYTTKQIILTNIMFIKNIHYVFLISILLLLCVELILNF